MNDKDNLLRLIYTSTAVDIDWKDVKSILHNANKRNAAYNITGILLYHNSWFAQMIEGPLVEINILYDKIKADRRHTNLRILSCIPTTHRIVEGWGMKGIGVQTIGDENMQALCEEFAHDEQNNLYRPECHDVALKLLTTINHVART